MKVREAFAVAAALGMLMTLAFAAGGDTNELALIDTLTAARASYEKALRDLVGFYSSAGYTEKYTRAKEELQSFKEIPIRDYLQLNSPVKPVAAGKFRSIKEADMLFEDGVTYKEFPDLSSKKKRLIKAIEHFQLILDNYPESDKYADACFMLGEIYAGFYFKDPNTGVTYYEKAILANPLLPYPAYYKAGLIYYDRIPRPKLAAEMFKKVIQLGIDTEENRQDAIKKLAKMRGDGLINE